MNKIEEQKKGNTDRNIFMNQKQKLVWRKNFLGKNGHISDKLISETTAKLVKHCLIVQFNAMVGPCCVQLSNGWTVYFQQANFWIVYIKLYN